jgi:cytochrome oxidase Cu insertion factor (SCO1/SenC/PrrC family)
MSRGVLFWLAVLFLFSGLAAIRYATTALNLPEGPVPEHRFEEPMLAIPEKPTMDAFELVDQRGKRFSSESLRGQVWVGSFFFASCPGACVLQNQRVQMLQLKYGPRGLKLVSITCDPERDSPAALNRYAERFQANPEDWVSLTGELDYIRKVGANFFQVAVAKETHGSHLLVFDRAGQLRGAFGATNAESFDRMNKLLDELLPGEPRPAPADQANRLPTGSAQPDGK